MNYSWKRWTFPITLAISGLFLMNWLDQSLFGLDPPLLGSALILVAAWWSLYLLQGQSTRHSTTTQVQERIEADANPRSRRLGWISLAVHLAITGYFFAVMQALNWNHTLSDPRARTMAGNIIFALVVWHVLSASWKHRPDARQSPRAPYSEYRVTLIALLAMVIGAAIYLALRAESLQPLPPMLVANALVGMILTASALGAASRLLPTNTQSP